jgi:hypothetical protein
MTYLLKKKAFRYYYTYSEGAKDNCSESEVNYLNVAQVMVDAVCITYHVISDSFVMELFYADCCDGSTYTFK